MQKKKKKPHHSIWDYVHVCRRSSPHEALSASRALQATPGRSRVSPAACEMSPLITLLSSLRALFYFCLPASCLIARHLDFWDKILLCISDWTVINYIAQSGLQLTILLPQPLECWDYRHRPPYLLHDWAIHPAMQSLEVYWATGHDG